MKQIKWLVKAAPFLYMGLIWHLSGRPADHYLTFPRADSLIKESLHLVEFAVLYLLFVLFFLVDGKLTKKTNLVSALVAAFYGFLDEIHQWFVPYRSATVIDVVKDVTGVTIAYILVTRGYFGHKNRLGAFMKKVENDYKNH